MHSRIWSDMVGAVVITLFVTLIFTSLGLHAQPMPPACTTNTEMKETLKTKFNEVVVSTMVSSQRMLMEVYASPEGSYTITFTLPSGLSCILQSGEGYTTIENKESTI